MKGKTRQLTIVSLLVLTALLAGAAIYVGYSISQQDQAPQDISASDGQTCCDNQCSRSDICWCAHLVGVGANKCTPQINADEWICGSGAYDGQVCYTCPTNHPEVPDNLEGQVLCTTVAADTCSDGKAACGGVTPEPEPEPEPEPKACGETCQTDSDCIGTTSAGDPVTCYNGVCRNETCPTDNSQGTICLCTSSPACGQPCGYFSGGGLCDNTSDGIDDTCRYINGPQCTLGSTGNPTTYCVPDDNPAIETLNCTARDQGNSYVRRKSDGKTSWTAAEIASLCQWCGNGIVDAGEECDPPGTDVDGKACGTDCKFVADEPEPTCGDGTIDTGEACDYGATPTGCEATEICNQSCACETTVTPQDLACEVLEGDTGNVAPGESKIYRLVVDHGTEEAPAADTIVLRVSSGTNDTAVGRDGYNTPTTALVKPINSQGVYFDPEKPTQVEYHFVWEATNVDGSTLTNGNYEVEVSLDGGVTWETISTCTLAMTYDSGETVNPNFLIVKESAAASCSTSTGVDISYTISVTNLGPVEGTLDYVEDQLDTNIEDSWVKNITSSTGATGVLSSGVITWTGTETQRTYSVDQTETFGYTVSVPASSLSLFRTGVLNTATVVFGDDQNRYNLVTNTGCFGDLPSTGITDEAPWIFAMLAVALGLVALKLNVGTDVVADVLTTGNKTLVSTMEAIGLDGIKRQKTKKKMEEEFGD